MKKAVLSFVIFSCMVFFAVSQVAKTKESTNYYLMLSNIEALADSEGGSSDSWDCWSSQKRGDGYWRCGDPCEWVNSYEGTGNTSKCYKK